MESTDPIRGLLQDSFFIVRILGPLLSLAVNFLDESVCLGHKTILLAFHFFGLRLHANGAPSLSGVAPLACNGAIRGNCCINLLGAYRFCFGYIANTSTSDSKNTEAIRSAWDL